MNYRTSRVPCLALLLIVAGSSLSAHSSNRAPDAYQNQINDTKIQDISFVKEAAGAWIIQRDGSAQEELAARLIAAKSDQDRKLILSEQPTLIDVGLRKSLVLKAESLRTKGSFAESLAVFELARQVAEQIKDQIGIAEISNYVGNLSLAQGKREVAMESYQKGLALCTSLQDKICVATALLGIGNVYGAKSEYDLALDFIRKALATSEESGHQPGIARALVGLGVTYYRLGNYPLALEAYQKALPIFESNGDTQRLAGLRNNIGNVHRIRGEGPAALESFQKSVELYEKLGDKMGIANATNGMGIVNSQRGDYGSAMRYFQTCLEIYEKLHYKKGIADSQSNVGIVQRLQGNYSLALEYQRSSLAASEALGEPQDIARSLNNLGLVYTDLGNYEGSLEAYRKSLKINETLGNKSEIGNVLQNIGVVHRYKKEYEPALEMYRKSLQIRELLGEKGQMASLLRSMGMAYQLKGDHKNAVTYAEQAARLAREMGLRDVLSSALTTAGNAYLALGATEKSRAAFEEAIATVEALRGQIAGGAQDSQRFFEGIVSPYYRMVQLLAAQGKTAEALSYAERGKARLLLDVLKSGRVSIDKTMTVAEREQERNIRDSFVLLNAQIATETRRPQPDQQRLGLLKGQLEAVRLSQQNFQTRLYAAHPELQIQRGDATPFTPEDAVALGADSRTALLEYVVTDEKTYLFVITRATNAATDVRVYTIPVNRSDLASQVENFRAKLTSHNLLIRQPARQAYDLLLKPAQTLLRGKTRLIIVPDDALWELPFQALMTDTNHYLIEQSAISYTPSLTVLREMSAKRKQRPSTLGNNTSLFALGNPSLGKETIERVRTLRGDETLEPLPEAEREVKTLGQLYGAAQSAVFVGSEAREDRAKSEAGKFRVLHFATHGVVNNVSPMYSHLVLSQGDAKEDGLLEAWELLNLDLKADLVVLSACETARGRVGAGEGMIGLSWALFVAGTPTAVVSQWKVDSASTTELMLEFHRNRLASNSNAQSLRNAMLKMRGSNKYQHPFYWAPFVVIGDAN